MVTIRERAAIKRELTAAIKRHSSPSGRYRTADEEVVIEDVVEGRPQSGGH